MCMRIQPFVPEKVKQIVLMWVRNKHDIKRGIWANVLRKKVEKRQSVIRNDEYFHTSIETLTVCCLTLTKDLVSSFKFSYFFKLDEATHVEQKFSCKSNNISILGTGDIFFPKFLEASHVEQDFCCNSHNLSIHGTAEATTVNVSNNSSLA